MGLKGGGYTLYRETEYLKFYEGLSESGKTKVVVIYSRTKLGVLGHIKWFGRWRQYAFFPIGGTVWNPDCLEDVQTEITRLRNERRAQ